MGTKFLYFGAFESGRGPLILDANVLRALQDLLRGEFPSALKRFTADDYGRYVRLAESWTGVARDSDAVEFGLFKYGRDETRNLKA